MLPCQNSETQIFYLDFRLPGILGVRISETQMFFRNLLLPTFWVSEFRKPKYFRPKFPFSVILSQLSIAKIFGCPNFGNPNVFSQLSVTHIFGSPNFGNPNFRPNPLVMLCCYYHIPHKMRQTIEIRISSTVSRNFGRLVRKSKKFHTNDPNVDKTCRN